MSRNGCPVCSHRDAARIDAALTAGQSSARVAGRHRLDRAAVRRHETHVQPAAPVEAADRPRATPEHARAFLGAMVARAEDDGVRVPTAARNWRDRVWTSRPGPGGEGAA